MLALILIPPAINSHIIAILTLSLTLIWPWLQIISSRKKDKELNHYEASGNLALALETMEKDGVRLVNIGQYKI